MLVSAGTGIAPFRAFLQDLQHEREEEELEDASSHRKAYLFYGCRSPAVDFIYSDELQDALAAGVLDRLDVAFSSNGHEPKRVRLWRLMRIRSVYVCVCVSITRVDAN